MSEIRLNLGSGDQQFAGFTSVDLYDPKADIQADICDLPFGDNSIDEIVAFQVIEHVEYWKEDALFAEIARVLKPGGTAWIECPDMEMIARYIIEEPDIDLRWVKSIYGEYYRPWDRDRYEDAENHEGSKHRNAFTYKKVERLANAYGMTMVRRGMDEKHPDYRYPETLSVTLTKEDQ